MRGCAPYVLIATSIAYGDGLPPASQLTTAGDAEIHQQYVRVTRAANNRAGAVWLKEKQGIRAGFDTQFTFRFTNGGGLDDGADGLAFVVHNSESRAIGGLGGSGGFGYGDINDPRQLGIRYSLAVFFDTFHNREYKDPSDNSLQICINGTPDGQKWPPSRLAVVRKLKVKLKDGREHRARVVYQPPVLSVYLDDVRLVETPADLSLVTDADGRAWVGFTASTGGGWENHDLLSWDWRAFADSSISMVDSSISFVLKACLPGKNLCTPEGSVVEERSPGEYHVVLPAHLEWGASIPNPSGRQVEVVNTRGLVCWDADKGQAGCGGPESGVLSRNQQGRTEFSIRDSGGAFADNQGYLEFDVRFR